MAAVHAEDEADNAPGKRQSKPRAANRGSLPARLPRVEEVIEPESLICACGGTLKDQDGAILLSETINADPVALLEHARSLGLEGIVGKHLDQPYRSGRTGDCVKLKCVQSEAFFIASYETSTGTSSGISPLVLAAYSGEGLVYVGNVGRGFKEAEAIRLRKMGRRIYFKKSVAK